jgi:hypothetical protein
MGSERGSNYSHVIIKVQVQHQRSWSRYTLIMTVVVPEPLRTKPLLFIHVTRTHMQAANTSHHSLRTGTKGG